MTRAFCLTLFFALSSIVMLPSAHAQDRYAALGFNTGQAFPDIVLPDIETQKPMSLAQFRGKKILVLHFASW